MALKTLKPRLATAPHKTIGGATHQPKSRWGHGRGGRPWRRKRQQVFERDQYTCQVCGRVGQPSELEADHIINVARGGTDDMENLQTICIPCHEPKTLAESQEAMYGTTSDGESYLRYQAMPEWLKPIKDARIVFGRPGSGKTTWAKENLKHGEILIDLDLIKSDITGKPLYHSDENDHGLAIRHRNTILSRLSKTNGKCLIVLTGETKRQRDWWVKKIQPYQVHTMDTPVKVCIDRIKNDKRRPNQVKQRQISTIENWQD